MGGRGHVWAYPHACDLKLQLLLVLCSCSLGNLSFPLEPVHSHTTFMKMATKAY